MRRRYQAFGLAVESDFILLGAMAGHGGQADLTIVAGTVPTDRGRADGPYALVEDGLVFSLQGVADYHANATGSQLVVEPAQLADPSMTIAMLLATALPMTLWLRGQILLHAAAAVLPGHLYATAWMGASGAGKSTLLRQNSRARLVTDDVLAVAPDGLCSGLPGGAWQRGVGEERSFLPVPAERQSERVSLGAIMLLESHAGDASRLPQSLALAAILRHLHRARVPRLLGLMPALLPRLASLARSVPVYSSKANTTDLGPPWPISIDSEGARRPADGVQESTVEQSDLGT